MQEISQHCSISKTLTGTYKLLEIYMIPVTPKFYRYNSGRAHHLLFRDICCNMLTIEKCALHIYYTSLNIDIMQYIFAPYVIQPYWVSSTPHISLIEYSLRILLNHHQTDPFSSRGISIYPHFLFTFSFFIIFPLLEKLLLHFQYFLSFLYLSCLTLLVFSILCSAMISTVLRKTPT